MEEGWIDTAYKILRKEKGIAKESLLLRIQGYVDQSNESKI